MRSPSLGLLVKGAIPSGHRRSPPVVRGKPRRPRQLLFPVTVAASSRPEATSAPPPTRSPPVVKPELQDGSVDGRWTRPQALEAVIEKAIYRCRFLAIIGVAGSLMGSIICFLKGCGYVVSSFMEYSMGGGSVILRMVEAIDIYLIGTVMLVFGMGLYEIFISNLDIAKESSHGSNLLGLFKLRERPKWLEIQSVNELKTKLGHVLVMALLIGLFEKSKKVTIYSPTDLLCFAASILLSSLGLYLLSKLQTSKPSKHASNGSMHH